MTEKTEPTEEQRKIGEEWDKIIHDFKKDKNITCIASVMVVGEDAFCNIVGSGVVTTYLAAVETLLDYALTECKKLDPEAVRAYVMMKKLEMLVNITERKRK